MSTWPRSVPVPWPGGPNVRTQGFAGFFGVLACYSLEFLVYDIIANKLLKS